MSLQPKTYWTPAVYLEMERQTDQKNEYLDGEIYAMGGASPRHVLIVTNVVAELRNQLKHRPCLVYSTDLRVRTSPKGLCTYPDIVVVCDQPQFSDEQGDTLINPRLIVGVLSKSTSNYDRGEKFEQYRLLVSLQEYVLIAQDKQHIEHFIRHADNTWLFSETNQLTDTVTLTAIGCYLKLAEVYDKIDWLNTQPT